MKNMTTIHTDLEYDRAMARHLVLMLSQPKPGTPEFMELCSLTTIIQEFENLTVQIDPPTEEELAAFLSEQD